MGLPARQALVNRKDGCVVCERWNDEMITVVEHHAVVCRPCATRIGSAILASSPAFVARTWPRSPSAGEAPPSATPTIDVEAVFAAFKEGVAKQICEGDAVSHFDLAVAYGEMGLTADAIREAATALGERAPARIASRALNWIFASGRAHPDALRTIARALRSA